MAAGLASMAWLPRALSRPDTGPFCLIAIIFNANVYTSPFACTVRIWCRSLRLIMMVELLELRKTAQLER